MEIDLEQRTKQIIRTNERQFYLSFIYILYLHKIIISVKLYTLSISLRAIIPDGIHLIPLVLMATTTG